MPSLDLKSVWKELKGSIDFNTALYLTTLFLMILPENRRAGGSGTVGVKTWFLSKGT